MTFLGVRGWDRKAWKYRLIGLLNRLPETCWTELVCWVEYGGSPLRDAFCASRCQQTAARCGACYCGKVVDPNGDPDWVIPTDEAVGA